MPRKWENKIDRILVELWQNGEKKFSHIVKEEDISNKCADFRTIAVRDNYEVWEIYVVRQCLKYGHGGADRKLSKEMRKKWNETLRKVYKT